MSDEPAVLDVRHEDDVAVVRLLGEVDLANAADLARLALERTTGAPAVAVDLSEVSWFDSAGMRLLDTLLASYDRTSTPVLVVAPEEGRARFVLRLCAFRDELLAGNLDAALAELRRSRGA